MTRSDDLEAILPDFIAEARDNLERFERSLIELESEPTSESALETLFRAIHSIKGSCGFFHLTQLSELTHAGENLLELVRKGRLSLSTALTSALLIMADSVRALLAQVEADGSEGALEVRPLVAHLEELARKTGACEGEAERGEKLAPEGFSLEGTARAGHESKVRVDTALLEKLMNLVGELVLARNQVVQHASGLSLPLLSAAAQRLSSVTSELQEVVMKTRMQPIEQVFNRFPRVARDLATTLGKRIRLEIEGRETELDKTLLEAIQDPLTHLVRNAIHHGIELPALRAAGGKPEEGLVRLRAFHEAGMVNIEVSDDGTGVDVEAVRRAALAHGIATAESLSRMTERELCSLIFMPGFSTQDVVTRVAGRGVGMDVVKTNIESIGGSVELHSERGRGTSLKVKIPLTLAILPALIVTAGGERFAVPQASLLEVVMLGAEQRSRVERIQGSPVLRLRGRILPLIELAQVLGLRGATMSDSAMVAVLQAGERSFGLVVDEINDTEEIVVKPLWTRLKGLGCYAGATVMGDGRVALILEPLGLAQRVGIVADEAQVAAALEPRAAAAATPRPTRQVLLCRVGSERLALELSDVARLEILSAAAIERSGGREVAQYRGKILPLLHVARGLEERRRIPRASQVKTSQAENDLSIPVVVCSRGGENIGLAVDAILDIVEVEVELQRSGARRGVLGSMVVQGRVTEFLDVEAIVRSADPGFSSTQARA